jgi:hypothetical protein
LSRNRTTIGGALLFAIAVAGCGGGSSAPAPAQTTPAAAPKSEAISRADALIADLKKREAALEQSTAAQATKSADPSVPVVVERSQAPAPPPSARDTGPTSPPIPPQNPRRSPVDVISSSYTMIERGKTTWKFSWKMMVRNQERTPIKVLAEMVFRDPSGSVIDYGRQTIAINGSTVAEVTGVAQIPARDAQRVTAATPRVALAASR